MESIASFDVPALVEPTQDEQYTLEEFSSDEDLYCQVEADFRRVGLAVKGIKHLKNHHCWMRYEDRKNQIEKRIPQADNFKMNETYLYHGTQADKLKLCEEGFDVNLASDGCFGKGIYFSDTPKKCLKYAKNGVILVARVILGTTKVYPDGEKQKDLVREPVKLNPGKSEWRYYDSVKGRPRNEVEYVVYRNELVLLEYIVEFTKTNDSSESFVAVDPTTVDDPTTVEEPEVTTETPNQADSDSSDTSSSSDDGEFVNAEEGEDYTSSSSSDEEEIEVGNEDPGTDPIQDSDSDDDEFESGPETEHVESVIPLFTIKEGDLTLDEKKAEYKRITQEENDSQVIEMLTRADEDLETAIYLFFAYKQVKEEEEKREAGEFEEEPFEDDGSPIFPPIEPEYESDSWNKLSEEEKKEKTDNMIDEFLNFTSLEEVHRPIAKNYVSSAKYNLDTALINFYSSCF